MSEFNPPPINTPPARKNSALAIWSLVLGIFSLTCLFSIFTAIPGVICGHMALGRIKRSGGLLLGQGWAIAGLITSYFGVALLFMMMLIAVPNFIRARSIAQRVACENNLRQIEHAKEQWAAEKGKQRTDTPTEHDLLPYLPDGMPHCPAGGVYSISMVGVTATCSIPGHKLE